MGLLIALALTAWQAGASFGSSSPRGGPDGPITGTLVAHGSLTEAEQAAAAAAAAASSPEAVAAMERSRTAYQDQTPAQVAHTLTEAFPTLITKQEGGPPPLPPGETVTGFKAANVAVVSLGTGQAGIVDSSVPMANESSSGHWQPVNLSLRDTGTAFEATNAAIPARLPKNLTEGAQLPSVGVSLIPADERGHPLASESAQGDGASVLFPNTQPDSDTLMKLLPLGIDVSTTLRSVASPEHLYYKVGMPAGAKLTVEPTHAVAVIEEGATLATIQPPQAIDATGEPVPVTTTVSGDLLTVGVAHNSGNWTYPIVVDPEFSTTWFNPVEGNWEFHEWSGFHTAKTNSMVLMEHEGSFGPGTYGAWSLHAQGYTKLYEFYTKDRLFPLNGEGTFPWLSAWIELFNEGGRENVTSLNGVPYAKEATVCLNPATCSPEGTQNGNGARFEVTTTESGIEPYGGEASSFAAAIAQEKGKHSEVVFNSKPQFLNGTENIMYNAGAWLGPHTGAFEDESFDRGMGVQTTRVEYEPTGGSSWESYGGKEYKGSASCVGIYCKPEQKETYTYNNLLNGTKHLPDGVAKIRGWADSVMPFSQSSEYPVEERQIQVDATPPHGLVVKGLASEGSIYQLGEVEGHIKVEATDGEGSTASSGVASIALAVDGHEIGAPNGYCTRGPCTATGEWAINGAELGVGRHTLTIVATDRAGNISAPYEVPLEVYAANPVAMGPGSVNPESGDFALEAGDVNLSGGTGSLSVSRHYDSRNVTEGEEGALGPDWTIKVNSVASLEVLPDGSVLIVGADGMTHFTVTKAGGFEPPQGDANLSLEKKAEYEGKEPAYLLKDKNQDTTTVFRLPSGAKHWMATLSSGPIATDATTAEYRTVEGTGGKKVIQPTLELAPHPEATCARAKLEKGCRGLEFVYDEGETTAKGEAESEWGSYHNRLKEVIAVAYNPATKAMGKLAVAAYEFDNKGRLRAEWDPRLTPALKTTYGYDAENHVAALTPPGQETWAFTYGAIPTDATTTGRLLRVTRAPATAALWKGELSKNTEAPKLSGSPVAGNKMSVSTGVWSGTPVVYGYQWEDCNSEGKACAAIRGATNPSYAPVGADIGHDIVAQVTAINGGAAVVASTVASGPVAVTASYTATWGAFGAESGKLEGPNGLAFDSSGDVWVDEFCLCGNLPKARVQEFNEHHEYVRTIDTRVGPSAETPTSVAIDSHGHLWVTEEKRVGEFSATGEKLGEFGTKGTGQGQFTEARGIAIDSHGNLWVTDTATDHVQEFNEKYEWIRTIGTLGEGKGEFKEPVGIAIDAQNNVWVADSGNNRIEEFNERGEFLRSVGSLGAGAGEFNRPVRLTIASAGDIWVTDSRNNRVELFNENGEWVGQFGSEGEAPGQLKQPSGVASDTHHALWITDYGNGRIEQWTPTTVTEGEHREPSPGSTIDYGVTLSGGGGLNPMTSPEVAKWGQKDAPVEAAAIFPANHPQGWPATAYTGATVLYMDSQARTVNEANPLGGVTTREYGPTGQVTRTLSADNRATALKESNTVEASERLATTSAYNAAGELTDTWGPLHAVRLAHGKSGPNEEAQARNHVHYAYDEGAPEGESYELVTKTVDGAETTNKEEFDKRTTSTAYSGQSNLGWTLRKPTSVTVDPGGLKLTATTTYNGTTGAVVETRQPAGTGGDPNLAPVPMLQFGSGGTHGLTHPIASAIDTSGNVWVAGGSGDSIEKFSSSGTWLATYGKLGSSETEVNFNVPAGIAVNKTSGNVYVGDQNNSRVVELNPSGALVRVFGKKGEAAGQLEEAGGVAVDGSGNVWVADRKNHRVDEFNETGTFLAAIGWGVSNGEAKYQTCTSPCRKGLSGTGAGEFNSPSDVAVAAGILYVSDSANDRVAIINEKREYQKAFGSAGTGSGQFEAPNGIAFDAAGNVYVGDSGNNRVDEFTAEGKTVIRSLGSAGTGPGQDKEPEGVSIGASGAVYVTDAGNNRIDVWLPPVSGHVGAQTMKTVYYSPGEEAEVAPCRNHKEWAGLPCQTRPAEQPGDSGPPELPITETAYNIWDQAETVTEKIGTITRTVHTTFDAADRPESTEQSAGEGAAVPKISDKYNGATGTVEEQTATSSGGTKAVKITHTTLGQLAKYTDADGNTAEYTYDQFGRLSTVTDGAEAGKMKRTLTYNEATNEVESLTDSGAGKFGATYGVGGRLATATYPNGMTASYTYNATGAATSLEYKKTTHCTEEAGSCVWYKDSTVPSIHGETVKESSTNGELPQLEYDNAGRLTKVEETPTGEGCQTRLYGYEEDANRTELGERQPIAEGKCAVEGGTAQGHTYDTGNRLTDIGITYDKLGNITTLPAVDAGGTALTSEFYVDNQVRKQSQNGETLEYMLDPEDRTRETVATGTKTGTAIKHYDAPGTVVAWTSTSSTWTRNIVGIAGEVAAVETSSGPAVLQLHDLQGNIVATAALSETETKVLSKIRNTEFGVPATKEAPPANAWLGAVGASSELSSGTIVQDGSTYVPQTGRPLQTQPIELVLPSNAAQPYSAPGPAWIAESDAAASALKVAEYAAARRAQEEAADPGGVVPSAGCNEEVEGCGADPHRGANPWQCKAWVSWYHGLHLNNWLGIMGHWHCNIAPPDIEVRTWLDHVVHGKEIGVEEHRQHWYYPGILGPVGSKSEHGEYCEEGWVYQAWVWARTWNPWNGEVNWESWESDGHTEACPGAAEDPTSGPPESPGGGTPVGGGE
jgi:YD repeat-containing protein